LIASRKGLLIAAAVAVGLVHTVGGAARAYSVASGVSDACHETITARAGVDILTDIPPPGSVHVPGGIWKELSTYLLEPLDLDLGQLDDTHRFLLTSLIIGSREPDTDGHSVMNIENLHQLHGDPSAVGQYSHALRGIDDDHEPGDAAAVAGTRALILELIEQATLYLELPSGEQLTTAQVYLDFYGRVDVKVWAPIFLVGRAGHVLQDSFSHTIRCDQDDLRRVAHVLNYIEAITTDFKEQRDGLAHSNSMDRCNSEAVQPLADAAVAATADLFAAARDQFHGLDPDAANAALDDWLTLRPGCTLDNEFCDNGHWLDVVRKDQTGPYVRGLFGCSNAGGTGSPGSATAVFLGLLALILALRHLGRSSS
jgi:hypothetical protein